MSAAVSAIPSAMAISPPGTPEASRRPHSMIAPNNSSPDVIATKSSRPQSMVAGPARTRSRLSMGSSRGLDEEAKTAVKVVVRVRPPLQPTDPGFDLIPQRFQRSTVNAPTDTTLSVESSQGRKIFIFDRVFPTDTTQNGVWEYLEDSVDSFLQGYNVSILAYGQSGAGKSYTMGTSGGREQIDPTSRGIIPRAAAHLFESLDPSLGGASHQGSGLKTPTRYSVNGMSSMTHPGRPAAARKWQMSVTYVEIYNEQPRDLLLPEGSSLQERAAVQIREDPKGRIFVEGLRSVAVNSVEELLRVLNSGSAIRQTDATAINSRSSRSHAVFTVNLRQNKPQNNVPFPKGKQMSISSENGILNDNTITVESKLHFVDLAGSERLKNTGATGDRAREGISINAGLASLGKVISQLSSRSGGGHVSYRDSKLTRMLQDSLGGNAITYMVACVTPAEFHLSETLNTVQYAQRARNIQSKPRIQQVNDDSDKQAAIERLRSEVAFLRAQIRSTDSNDRKPETPRERHNAADVELQNQMLDLQEGYRALSERHAKLVGELTKTSREVLDDHIESPAERLKIARQSQEQIEQIITEYEKTIQSLQEGLSSTRTTLAETETSLLERETKCAYIETMNQQLTARIQKLIDREASTEQYLHDLESRLQDSTTGSEKHESAVADLRREMERIRESGSNAEDYISTLEERLAESDQDMEIMSREIVRLEQLVARQQSLGRLDNLLYELDATRNTSDKEESANRATVSAGSPVSGPSSPTGVVNGVHKRRASEPMESILESKEVEPNQGAATTPRLKSTTDINAGDVVAPEPSPAQSAFMTEKFESVSQELFDLRLEHESTMNELDLMSAKYQEALRTLAEMHGQLDDVQSGPGGTMSPAESSRRQSIASPKPALSRGISQRSNAHSVSSELSAIVTSPTSPGRTASVHTAKETATPASSHEEVERLQALLAEHEDNMDAMKQQYSQLKEEHKDTLDVVEKLRNEANRSRSPMAGSPSPHNMIRRPTSQLGHLGNSIDRGQRSIVSLRTLLSEEFENKPDSLETAEVHLMGATYELQSRINRIQSLEADLHNVKKEMEMKTTIISGLTRERNSLKSGTPVDLSMVSQMRDQLIQKETELKRLHEGYGQREQQLQSEIAAAKAQMTSVTEQYEQAKKDLDARDQSLRTKTTELEAALADAESMKLQLAASERTISDVDGSISETSTAQILGQEREKYQGIVDQLKHDLEQQISTNSSHTDRIEELTQMHEAASKDIHDHSQIIQEKCKEIDMHKVKIATLNSKVKEAESAVEFHKHGLKSLHQSHSAEIEEMKLSHAGILAGYDDQLSELNIKHGKALNVVEAQLEDAKSSLNQAIKSASDALGHATAVDMLGNHITDVVEEKKVVFEANKRLVSTNAELEMQLTGRQNLAELEQAQAAQQEKISNYQETIKNLANEVGNHEDSIREKEKIIARHEEQVKTLHAENAKKVTLIEELEEQLQASFEQHQKRVSNLQQQGSQALSEAQNRISRLEKEVVRNSIAEIDEEHKRPVTTPQSPGGGSDNYPRSNSISSNLRKSASVASLPSPPPAIPLPPLPNMPNMASATAGNPSPPQSRHTSKEVAGVQASSPTGPREGANHKRQSTVIEDQENRLRTMEKHLHAEKQLTATLEEALVDLETQSNKLRVDAESWKKRVWALESEVADARKESRTERLSMQQVQEEVNKRKAAEEARAQLEERMRVLKQSMDGTGKKKKKATLNCF